MDDERLTVRLRALDAPDVHVQPRAEFVEQLHGELASRLGFPTERERPAGRRVASSRVRRLVLIAAAVALLIAVIGNLGAIGATIQRLLDRPTLMDTIDATGSLRVAIRPDEPQVLSAGGTLSGFDIDVAEALAERLGWRVERIVEPIDRMLDAEEPAWQMAMPSRALSADEAARYVASEPYYGWPAYVVASRSGPIDVGTATLCVVAGSAGEAWAASRGAGTVRALPDDESCLAELAAGRSDGLVTSLLLPVDIANDPDLVIVGDGPVVREPRAIVVPRQASDASGLADTINAALAELRADGTLRDLAKRRFGGEDLAIGTP